MIHIIFKIESSISVGYPSFCFHRDIKVDACDLNAAKYRVITRELLMF